MNPHSKLASLYRYFYMEETLPNNLCNYFWGLFFAIICLPFTWLAILHNRVYNPITKHENKYANKTLHYYTTPFKPLPTALGLIFTVFTFVIGAVTLIIFEKITGVNTRAFINQSTIPIGVIKMYMIGILGIIGSIGLFNVLIALLRLLPKKAPETEEEFYARLTKENQRNKERMEHKRNNPNIFTLAWRWLVAFKEKNCPLIEWDYTKKEEK